MAASLDRLTDYYRRHGLGGTFGRIARQVPVTYHQMVRPLGERIDARRRRGREGADLYLTMQQQYYEREAREWSFDNPDPVVGSYLAHNAFPDYDTRLFRGIETNGLVAIEYGCGPGRNLIRFADRFARVDGVDIGELNIRNARRNLEHAGLPLPRLYVNDGRTIPTADESYDIVFAVICFQHICVHEIRQAIFEEAYRVLKPGGRLCAQMGFGYREGGVGYYDNAYDVIGTNGWHDVMVTDASQLSGDLEAVGFTGFDAEFGEPCQDHHEKWIWFQATKPA